MAADGQVIFEVVADGKSINQSLEGITRTIEAEGKEWDKSTKESTDKMADSFDGMSGKASKAISNLTGKIINMAVKGVNKMMEYSDAVDKGRRSIGISAKAYQELDYAMSMSGANIDTLTRGVGNLNSALAGTASSEVKNALSGLGFSDADIASMSSMEELLDGVLYRLAGVQDTAERANIANSLFGVGAGSQLAAFFDEGAEGIKNLRQQAVDLGIVQSDEAIEQAVKTQDALDTLNKTLNSVLMEALTPLLPVITDIATLMLPVLKFISDLLNQLLTPLLKLVGLGPSKAEVGKEVYEDMTASGESADEYLKTRFSDTQSAAYAKKATELMTEIERLRESGENEAADAYMENLYTLLGEAEEKANASTESVVKLDEAISALPDKKEVEITVNTYTNGTTYFNGYADPLGVFGNHANGLDNVPYDGYIARLHQGERVQTAAEAELSRRYGNQAPGTDLGSAIRAGVGSMQIVWRGRVVADVLSEQQGDSFRALERSGWKS